MKTPRAGPDHVRLFRLHFGLTQASLAEYLGTSRVTINRWEAGKVPVPPHLLFTLRGLGQYLKNREGETE